MVYGIPSNFLSLSNKVVFIGFGYNFPSALLEYLDLFKPFVGSEREPYILVLIK